MVKSLPNEAAEENFVKGVTQNALAIMDAFPVCDDISFEYECMGKRKMVRVTKRVVVTEVTPT